MNYSENFSNKHYTSWKKYFDHLILAFKFLDLLYSETIGYNYSFYD
jgi:hypothetical protein